MDGGGALILANNDEESAKALLREVWRDPRPRPDKRLPDVSPQGWCCCCSCCWCCSCTCCWWLSCRSNPRPLNWWAWCPLSISKMSMGYLLNWNISQCSCDNALRGGTTRLQLLETAVSPYQTCGGLIFTGSPASVQQATIIHRKPDFPHMNVLLKNEASNASLKKKEKEKKMS